LVTEGSTDCQCPKLIFSSGNMNAVVIQNGTYGEYFLFDSLNGAPVYQKRDEGGVYYLSHQSGNWGIKDNLDSEYFYQFHHGNDVGDTACIYR